MRLLRKAGHGVTAVLTEGGGHFVTPLSLQALTETRVYTDLWSLTDESEMGHIELSRAADLLVVAPASADILACMATGRAHDLATTLLLATDKPVLAAPAMNVRMWLHPATLANVATLRSRGVGFVGPDEGVMACHEFGPGRLAEPPAILAAIEGFFAPGRLAGKPRAGHQRPHPRAHRPGALHRQPLFRPPGHGDRHRAAARLGAQVTLVSGPTAQALPAGATVRRVETATEMLAACQAALPADAAVCAAAVADWHVEPAVHKLKKQPGAPPRQRCS